MEKKEIEKQRNESKEIPLATMVINEYKTLNKTHAKTNKNLTILVIILSMLLAIETTYIILYWDSIHPHAGIIREDCDE